MKKQKYFVFLFILIMSVFISYRGALALFSDAGQSTGNVFSASTAFPTAIPTITPIPTITLSPTPIIAQTIVINEVLPVSNCNYGGKPGLFLELWNGTNSSIDLKEIKLSNNSGNSNPLANLKTLLPSHSFVILVNQKDSDISQLITTCFGGNIYGALTESVGSFDITTGILKILDKGNVVIDKVLWGSSPNPTPSINQSIERDPTGHDSVTGDNFTSSDFVVRPTPRPGQ